MICPTCNGVGETKVQSGIYGGVPPIAIPIKQTCPTCNGKGKI